MAISWNGVAAVFRKEVREGSRDRNLLIGVIFVPLFLYPLLGFGALQVMQVIQGMSRERATTVAVSRDTPLLVREKLADREGFEVRDLPGDHRAWVQAPPAPPTYRAHRDSLGADATLLWRKGTSGDSAFVYFDRSRDRSRNAADALREDAEAWRDERVLAAFVERGLTETDVEPWRVNAEDIATAGQRGREILSIVLPMILLYMLVTGTYYSALDAVVGERERGTIETLLTSPLGRAEVLVGKYLFVGAASLVALLLNLFSMVLFVKFVISFAEDPTSIQVDLSLPSLGLILLTGLLLASLLSAVMMLLAVPAQNYRQGQAALGPVMFLVALPGLVVATSQEAFNVSQACVPIVNAVALLKSAIQGEFPLVPIVITLTMLAGLTAAALAFAAGAVGNLEILFDSGVTLRSLLTRRGRKRP